MDASEMVLVSSYPGLPKRAFYIIGLLRASTQLSLSTLLPFFSSIYSSLLPDSSLREIESLLVQSKLGQAKSLFESLNSSFSKCTLCLNSLKCDIKLNCGDCFHKNCLTEILISQVLGSNEAWCPDCGKKIENLGNVDIEIYNAIEERKLENRVEKKECLRCPVCWKIYEFPEAGPFLCESCNRKICIACLKVAEECTCKNYCQICFNESENDVCSNCVLKL
jgi:hypothetical protein